MSVSVERLLAIMSQLRDPENGCPWDKAQTYATIAPYTWKRPMRFWTLLSGRILTI